MRVMKYRIVNIVVSGNLGTKVILENLLFELGNFYYNPESYHGGYLKLSSGLTVTIYRTGKYIMQGIRNIEGIQTSFEEMKRILSRVIDTSRIEKPKIQNIVVSGEVGKILNLGKLAISLPYNVEYDPEQFPGLIIRVSKSLTVLLFSTGRFVIVGARDIDEIEKTIEELGKILED